MANTFAGRAFSRMDWPVAHTAFTNSSMTGTAHKVAVLVQALAPGNIRKVHFRTQTVTTGDTVRASIQGRDAATGDPDGTIANSGDSAANTTVANADDNTWKTTASFTTDYAVSTGDRFFVVLDYPSYVAGSMQIQRSSFGSPNNFTYVDVYAASWTKTSSSLNMTLELDDGTYLPCIGLVPSSSAANTNFNSSSSPNEYALRFVLNTPMRLWGFWFWTNNFSGDTQGVLYTGGAATDTTATATAATIDKDEKVSTSNFQCFMQFATPADLVAGTVYRLSIKPTTTTSVGYTRPTAAENNASLATLGMGTDWYESTRAGGNWTDNNTNPCAIFPVFSGADDGVPTPPRMLQIVGAATPEY